MLHRATPTRAEHVLKRAELVSQSARITECEFEVNEMNCSVCNNPMNPGARFCSNCGGAVIQPPVVPVYPTRLVRPRYGRVFGGVCASLAQHFGWDVVLVRILLCVIVLFGCGTPILAYLIAWIAIPNEPFYFAVPPVAAPPAAPVNTQPTA
jgi:phage shock protein C